MRKFWSFKALSESAAELLIYSEISDFTWWGDEVTPATYDADLKALGNITELSVRINSPGGDVFAASAIYTMLRRHAARVTVTIDGLAASAATIVMMAGDKIVMPQNAMLMVHNPWSFAAGNAEDLRKMADTLDTVRESMLAVYQEKTGMGREDLIALLDEETWITAAQAVELGFADEIEEMIRIAAKVRADDRFEINGVAMNLKTFPEKMALTEFECSAPGGSLEKFRSIGHTMMNSTPEGSGAEDKAEEAAGGAAESQSAHGHWERVLTLLSHETR